MSSVKPVFNIVESHDDFDYDSFYKDYMNMEFSKDDLMRKYNLSKGQYLSKSRHCKNDTGFIRQKGTRRPAEDSFIDKMGKKYVVRKTIDGVQRRCGSYPDLKTARLVRDILIEHNWSDEVINNCIKVYGAVMHHRGADYNGDLTRDALRRYSEFEDLYFGGEYSYRDILELLGFSRHQYNVCLKKLKEKYPDARKKLVKNVL